jgi:hypothetical protein
MFLTAVLVGMSGRDVENLDSYLLERQDEYRP